MNSLAGRSEVKPDKGDKRFRDPVWASNPAYKVLMSVSSPGPGR